MRGDHFWSLLCKLLPEGGLLETLHPLVLGRWASLGLCPGKLTTPGLLQLGGHTPLCLWADAPGIQLALLEVRPPPAPTPPIVVKPVRGRIGLLESQISLLFQFSHTGPPAIVVTCTAWDWVPFCTQHAIYSSCRYPMGWAWPQGQIPLSLVMSFCSRDSVAPATHCLPLVPPQCVRHIHWHSHHNCGRTQICYHSYFIFHFYIIPGGI